MIRLFSLITFGSSSATACLERLAALRRLLELGGHVVERLGHRHVQRDVRVGDALVRRHRAELELVAGERERAGAVAVAGVARQLRQHQHAGVEHAAAAWSTWRRPSRSARRCRSACRRGRSRGSPAALRWRRAGDRCRRWRCSPAAAPATCSPRGAPRCRTPGTAGCRAGSRPGVSRLCPSSSLIDQLRCLPEPLTPANGFSCSRQASPYFGAVRFSVSIVII